MNVDEEIAREVELYVNYCRMAANHDEWEEHHRAIAHKIFYHIQELRSTRIFSMFGKVTA